MDPFCRKDDAIPDLFTAIRDEKKAAVPQAIEEQLTRAAAEYNRKFPAPSRPVDEKLAATFLSSPPVNPEIYKAIDEASKLMESKALLEDFRRAVVVACRQHAAERRVPVTAFCHPRTALLIAKTLGLPDAGLGMKLHRRQHPNRLFAHDGVDVVPHELVREGDFVIAAVEKRAVVGNDFGAYEAREIEALMRLGEIRREAASAKLGFTDVQTFDGAEVSFEYGTPGLRPDEPTVVG